MAQPIKKKIQEVHSSMVQEESFKTLLIDGNSLLFMCFKDNKVNSNGIHYGGVFQFLLQLRMMISKAEFEYVYVFFDNTYSGWLRYNVYPLYKANRDKKYSDYNLSEYMRIYNENLRSMQDAIFSKNKSKSTAKVNKYQEFLDANFERERDILCKYFNELYIRWNIDEITEGDDQIAYYCLHKKPNEKIIIMTGDMDLFQLLSDDIAIYELHKKKFITTKNFQENFGYNYKNVLIKKIFIGDVSDNIGNIKGLSEEGFYKLIPEVKTRSVTIDEVKKKAQELIDERIKEHKKPLAVHENIIKGISNKEYNGDFYEINKKIIDLCNPLLSDDAINEMNNMMYAPQDITDRSFKNLYKFILEDNIEDLIGDTKFASFFLPFKKIEEKEIKRYNESLK